MSDFRKQVDEAFERAWNKERADCSKGEAKLFFALGVEFAYERIQRMMK